jgi:hypothetical protein
MIEASFAPGSKPSLTHPGSAEPRGFLSVLVRSLG